MITSFGDSAMLLAVPAGRVAAVSAALIGDPRFRDVVPAANSVLVTFDPLADRRLIRWLLRRAVAAPDRAGESREHRIPVVYDGEDLAAVAEMSGLSVDGVIAAHQSALHTVRFLGFAPGFPYLAGSPFDVPRLATPRDHTPAGSVALAGRWTGIYPSRSPGGWHIIGRTVVRLFDPAADPPALLAPGDTVRFIAQ